jgi:hypothetical protein
MGLAGAEVSLKEIPLALVPNEGVAEHGEVSRDLGREHEAPGDCLRLGPTVLQPNHGLDRRDLDQVADALWMCHFQEACRLILVRILFIGP